MNGVALLRPPPPGVVPTTQNDSAITTADDYDNGPGSRVTSTQLALVGLAGRPDLLAWVVTFTWDHPVDNRQGLCAQAGASCGPPAGFTHHHVLVDATTGTFAGGFQTA